MGGEEDGRGGEGREGREMGGEGREMGGEEGTILTGTETAANLAPN